MSKSNPHWKALTEFNLECEKGAEVFLGCVYARCLIDIVHFSWFYLAAISHCDKTESHSSSFCCVLNWPLAFQKPVCRKLPAKGWDINLCLLNKRKNECYTCRTLLYGATRCFAQNPPITTTTTTTNNNNNNKNANKNSFIDPVYGIPGLPILKLCRFFFFLHNLINIFTACHTIIILPHILYLYLCHTRMYLFIF